MLILQREQNVICSGPKMFVIVKKKKKKPSLTLKVFMTIVFLAVWFVQLSADSFFFTIVNFIILSCFLKKKERKKGGIGTPPKMTQLVHSEVTDIFRICLL